MSSVKFEGGKSHGNQQASSYLIHSVPTPENRARVRDAKLKQGEDCFIDPAKSVNNFSIVDGEITTDCDYKAVWDRYKNRIEQIDSNPLNTNKRKDRVTMMSLEIPVPEGLSGEENRDRRKQWFLGVYFILCKKYGENNMVQCAIHEDEVHTYIDAETHEDRVSREHMHISFVPEKDGQLNGKWFSKRSNIQICNRSIDDYTRDEFDCEFHTGTKKRSDKKIEEIKAESRKLMEQRELERQKAEADKKILEDANKTLQQEVSRLRQEKLQQEEELELMKETAKKYQSSISVADVQADIDVIKAERERLEHSKDEVVAFLDYLDTRHNSKGKELGVFARKWYDDYLNGVTDMIDEPVVQVVEEPVIQEHINLDRIIEEMPSKVTSINEVWKLQSEMPTTVDAIKQQQREEYQRARTEDRMRQMREKIEENQRAMRQNQFDRSK